MQSREVVAQPVAPVPSVDVKASVTALSVAMAYTRALSMQSWNISNPAEIALATHLWQTGRVALSGFNYVFSSTVSQLPFSMQHSIFNTVVAPGCDETIMLRKVMIAHQIEQAIANGATQIVFLGGGYDVRAFMTAKYHSNVYVYELDRGPTRENKIKGLMSIPKGDLYPSVEMSKSDLDGTIMVGGNLFYIECDVARDNLVAKLTSHRFDTRAKTLFVGEGLTMYLSDDENRRLLHTLSSLMNDESACLLSYMKPRLEMGVIESNALKGSGEMYRCVLQPAQVLPFVNPCGFDVVGKCNASDRLPDIGVVSSGFPNETYYMLHKSSAPVHSHIEGVPQIQFPVPRLNPTASMCVLV